VLAWALLFVRLPSASFSLTETRFVIVPAWVGRTTMVTVAVAPVLSVFRLQVTIPPAREQLP
jgi:hypothetical protein